jgi:DNA primase
MSGNAVRHDRLLAAHTEAQRFYRQQLLTSAGAQGPCHYLAQRGLAHVLAPDSIWEVGCAPARWTDLAAHLTHLGFVEGELLAAGLACRSRRGGIVDRFRDLIMFPQRDEAGHVVGFIGRAAPGAPGDVPKYLNTPQTPIYHKRQVLFGLHEQRQALAVSGRLVLVEGPLDVLAIAAATTPEDPATAVAPCGTALTREHVELLTRCLPDDLDIIVAYDNDQAGRRATAATHELLADADAHNHTLLAATLPRGQDPAELLQVHGSAALRAALTRPHLTPLVERAIDARLGPWAPVLDGLEGRIAAVKDLASLIGRLPRADVAQHVVKLADRVALDPITVSIAVTETLTEKSETRPHVRRGTAPNPPAPATTKFAGIPMTEPLNP